MQHRAVFGGVDPLAGEHAAGPAGQVALRGELAQQLQRLVVDAVLGEVEQQFIEIEVKMVEPGGIFLKQVAQVYAVPVLAVFRQGFPGGAGGGGRGNGQGRGHGLGVPSQGVKKR